MIFRRKTIEVKVGELGIGGLNPVRIQSMTTTDTMDTIASVKESIKIIEAGGELVRLTAPSIKEAENLLNIKKELQKQGYNTPLVADIHFTPNAAEVAARIVEKVRINPGNYVDKKKFEQKEYSESEYHAELDRIRLKFTPLVKICKEYGTAMRIGTNHGSLSDRILNRFGDTPLGMVESALEFLRICNDESYHNIIISMKASNPLVMIEAYRLLVKKMDELGFYYPLHLGVTEAGDGEDGRIKSAVGIGTLLQEGLGDTIRVSLTENPENEIPVAQKLVNLYKFPINENFKHEPSIQLANNHHTPIVIGDLHLHNKENISPANLFPFGYHYNINSDKWNISDLAADAIYINNEILTFEPPSLLNIITNKNSKYTHNQGTKLSSYEDNSIIKINNIDYIVVEKEDSLENTKLQLITLKEKNYKIVLLANYSDISDFETYQLKASAEIGNLLVDNLIDGLWLVHKNQASIKTNSIAFGILQAARKRITKTEYIACPSCGRTLFNLQETTSKIRAVTNHLKGVKIGIMGCIVNGPGEMADADFGYVGTGIGKITLYKGQEVIKRNIPEEQAVEELIQLIKDNNAWVNLN